MTQSSTNSPATALPAININTLVILVLSGAVGTITFDVWGQVIAPLLGLGSLAPVGLARGFLGAIGLPSGASWGNLMHLVLVGLIAYPVGWMFIARPILARFVPGLHWTLASVLYGIGLWVFAIGGIAAIAGNPPFLGFARISWVALAGHIFFATATAATVAWLERRPAQ